LLLFIRNEIETDDNMDKEERDIDVDKEAQ
jgi:hypothetical protein